MKTLSAKSMQAIKASATASLQRLDEGKDVREIVKDIYCTLPDKSEEIGYRMADHFATLVEDYHNQMDSCMVDDDAYLDKQIAEAVEGKTPEEVCRTYHRMLVVLAAGEMISEADSADPAAVETAREKVKAFVAEQEDITFDATNATEETIQKLAWEVKGRLKDSRLVTSQLPQLLLEMQDETMEAADIVPEFGRKSNNLKLILAVQAYVEAKKGTLEDVDPNVSMRDVTFMACATVDTCAVAAQLEEGRITVEMAAKIMGFISYVLTAALVLSALFLLSVFVTGFLISFFSVTSVVGLILSAVVAVLVTAGILNQTVVSKISNATTTVVVFIGFAIGTVAGLVVRGLKKLVEFFKEKMPMVAQKACDVVQHVKDTFAPKKEKAVRTENPKEAAEKATSQATDENEGLRNTAFENAPA